MDPIKAAPVSKAPVKAPAGAVILYEPMTKVQFQDALPAKMRKSVNQALLDTINNTMASQETLDIFKENLLSYGDVLKEGKFKITNYIAAVKYVSYKLLGGTNKQAYAKTYPDKILKFKADGISDKDIASYTTAFHKSKLVMLIMEQSLVPTHVMNAPLLQAAINVQAELMMSANSEKVRSDAAACLIKELKPPDDKKFELDVVVKQDDSIAQLAETTRRLAVVQQELIETKQMTTTEVANSNIVLGSELNE